jgi:hypothetical protein
VASANPTSLGLDEDNVRVGDEFRAGTARLFVTEAASLL